MNLILISDPLSLIFNHYRLNVDVPFNRNFLPVQISFKYFWCKTASLGLFFETIFWNMLFLSDLTHRMLRRENIPEFYEVFPVFELILYLQGRHEYSSKHSSSLFNKRYLPQHTGHSCFNCSIRVEMNRQQLLGVAREVQSFSSPSLNNR